MGENEKVYKYDAFISYRHLEPDQSIAKEIHRMIERFTPPKLSCFSRSGRACCKGFKQFH